MYKDDKKKLEKLLEEYKNILFEYADFKEYDETKIEEAIKKSVEINDLFRKYGLLWWRVRKIK